MEIIQMHYLQFIVYHYVICAFIADSNRFTIPDGKKLNYVANNVFKTLLEQNESNDGVKIRF